MNCWGASGKNNFSFKKRLSSWHFIEPPSLGFQREPRSTEEQALEIMFDLSANVVSGWRGVPPRFITFLETYFVCMHMCVTTAHA